MIPDDILAVAGVVTGEDRTNLTGWQRRDAIAAMTALGYSGRHIAWALDTSRDAVYQTATAIGIRLNRTDQRPDWTAIDMVVTGAARLHLSGIDRTEVIRQLASRHTCTEIARRLLLDATEVSRVARKLGVTLREGDHWNWYAYLNHHGQRSVVMA